MEFFLLYFEVGTVDLRVVDKDMEDLADAGTGKVGNCISSALGTKFPGIIKTFSCRALVVGPVVLAPLLEVALSPETLDGLPMSFTSG